MRRFSLSVAVSTIVVVGGLLVPSQPAQGQVPPTDSGSVPLIQKHDAVAAVGVAALTLGAMALDERLAGDFQRSSVQSNSSYKGAANVFNTIGFPGSVIVIAGTYFYGLAEHSRPVASLGMHTGEAAVLGGVLAELLKGSIGRARPLHDTHNAFDFKLGKGFSDDNYTSLPSAHVTVAFAAATAASREVRRSWPSASKYVTPITYSLASLVGVARMYKNEHWASDVVAAAGLGVYSGVLFDRYNQGHRNNVFERMFLPSSIVPTRHGVAVAWSFAK